MKAIKYSGALVIAGVLLFLFVVNFSAIESHYECVGEFPATGTLNRSTAYIRIRSYRWWVGLWSDSDGDVRLEIPNKAYDYYGHTEELGDQLFVGNSDKSRTGMFSHLSYSLSIRTSVGAFDGKCKRIDRP